MRHLHQRTRDNANITMRSSGRVSTMLCENHSKCSGATFAPVALCHLPGSRESLDIRFGYMAHSRVGQQLLDGHLKKLECKFITSIHHLSTILMNLAH